MSHTRPPDEVPDTIPMRTRFLMLDGKPRALTTQVRHVGGRCHKGFRVLYDVDGVAETFTEDEWKEALMSDRITPIEPDETIEHLSDKIGEKLTPQGALNKALAHLRLRSIAEEHDLNPESAAMAGVRHG